MDRQPTALDLINFLCVLVLSVAIHEMAHAWLADRFGDDTPRRHGRMTLNPFAHVHPILTILLPAYMFWTSGSFFFAAMTPVSPWRMRRPKLHGTLTALGGPAASLLLGVACFVALVVFVAAVGGWREDLHVGHRRMLGVLDMAVQLNVFGAAFNLVPIPPLDGSALVGYLLPTRAFRIWEGMRRYSWILFAVLVFSGILGRLLDPVMDATFRLVLLGIDLGNGIAGG